MRVPFVSFLALSLAVLVGCSEFPDLSETIEPAARQAPYPALIPIDDLLGAETGADRPSDTTAELQARARALRARAARLRQLIGL
ncbi:MAG: hypothetical protein R3256_04680 [Thalassovita sp.]|nr:hypothetical protein [Thalassovita sp.]